MTLTENQVAKNSPVKNLLPKNRPLVTKTAGIINITDKPSV